MSKNKLILLICLVIIFIVSIILTRDQEELNSKESFSISLSPSETYKLDNSVELKVSELEEDNGNGFNFVISKLDQKDYESVVEDGFNIRSEVVDIHVEEELSHEVELTMHYSNVSKEENLVVLHFGENGYEVLEGEINVGNNTITVPVDSFSPFVVCETDKKVYGWNSIDFNHIEVNKVYTFDEEMKPFFIDDLNSFFNSSDYWGVLFDPTYSDKGSVLFSSRIHNDTPSNRITGYSKKMTSVIDFGYKNDIENVEEFIVSFDAFVDVSINKGIQNADYLALQVRTSPFSFWTTLKDTKYNVKYVQKTNQQWMHLEYDLSDAETLTTWAGARDIWGFRDYPTICFRILFKSGRDKPLMPKDGNLTGAYIDNLEVKVNSKQVSSSKLDNEVVNNILEENKEDKEEIDISKTEEDNPSDDTPVQKEVETNKKISYSYTPFEEKILQIVSESNLGDVYNTFGDGYEVDNGDVFYMEYTGYKIYCSSYDLSAPVTSFEYYGQEPIFGFQIGDTPGHISGATYGWINDYTRSGIYYAEYKIDDNGTKAILEFEEESKNNWKLAKVSIKK